MVDQSCLAVVPVVPVIAVLSTSPYDGKALVAQLMTMPESLYLTTGFVPDQGLSRLQVGLDLARTQQTRLVAYDLAPGGLRAV
jgi:hypothetical protein